MIVIRFKSLLLMALTAGLIACGGGGDGAPIVASIKLADCFQVNTQNAFRMSVVHSPASYKAGNSAGFSGTGVNSAVDPVTGLPLSSPTPISASYPDSIYDISYRQSIYQNTPATVKNRVGNVFVAGTASQSPVAFDNDYYFSISSNSMTHLGSTFLGTQGGVLSEIDDRSFNLSFAIGESSVSQSTISFSPTAQATDGTISKTISYIAREDVSTPAGLFKSSCKLDVEEKTTTTTLNRIPASERSTIWVAPGWGVIKEVSMRSYSDGRLPSLATRNRQAIEILRGSL